MLKFFLYWLVGHAHSSLKRLGKNVSLYQRGLTFGLAMMLAHGSIMSLTVSAIPG